MHDKAWWIKSHLDMRVQAVEGLARGLGEAARDPRFVEWFEREISITQTLCKVPNSPHGAASANRSKVFNNRFLEFIQGVT